MTFATIDNRLAKSFSGAIYSQPFLSISFVENFTKPRYLQSYKIYFIKKKERKKIVLELGWNSSLTLKRNGSQNSTHYLRTLPYSQRRQFKESWYLHFFKNKGPGAEVLFGPALHFGRSKYHEGVLRSFIWRETIFYRAFFADASWICCWTCCRRSIFRVLLLCFLSDSTRTKNSANLMLEKYTRYLPV